MWRKFSVDLRKEVFSLFQKSKYYYFTRLLIVVVTICIFSGNITIAASSSAIKEGQSEYDELLNEIRELRKELDEWKEIFQLLGITKSQLQATKQNQVDPSTSSAKASKLISDLRNAKAAGIMWLGDKVSTIADALAFTDEQMRSAWNTTNMIQEIAKYMDSQLKAEELIFVVTQDSHYLVGKLENDTKVIEKSIAMAGGALFDKLGNALTVDNAVDGVYIRVK